MTDEKKPDIKAQLHLAAQYLAAAGISFSKSKEDDSHTNLGYDISKGHLFSRPLSERGDLLALKYDLFALEWIADDNSFALTLDGASHLEVVQWIQEKASRAGIASSYTYDLHYELPYTINDGFKYQIPDTSELQRLKKQRAAAQVAIEGFLKNNDLSSEVRVWPHHFDTGAYTELKEYSGSAVGMGLAIPDSVCEEHYFYMSGYVNNKSLDPESLAPLKHGKWISEGFKGAILPFSLSDEGRADDFFEEAFSSLKAEFKNAK